MRGWMCSSLSVMAMVAIIAGCSGEGGQKPSPATATTPATDGSSKKDPAAPAPAELSGLVEVDGSSTVFPVTEAVAEEFQIATGGKVRVTVGISGTGGGFKKFARGETAVQDASRPILEGEMAAARENGVTYIELPVCFDALTVAIHNDNDWVDHLTVDELKKIWEPAAQGVVTKWSQVRDGWPDDEIVLYGAGSDSGTFDYFTEAICGKAKSSRGDYTGSEDDNVLVQGIEGNKFALGYLPYAYFAAHSDRMKAVPILWEGNTVKEPVLPSMENVLKGIYNPLARPLFIYVSTKQAERPEVAAFVEFYLKNAEQLAAEVKYLPLPSKAYEMGLKRFQSRQSGTGFGGVPEVGLPVEEIFAREPKS